MARKIRSAPLLTSVPDDGRPAASLDATQRAGQQLQGYLQASADLIEDARDNLSEVEYATWRGATMLWLESKPRPRV